MGRALFAAGSFWGVEFAFRQIPGVINATVGYAGGEYLDPKYEAVVAGKTDHVEAVLLEFNEKDISYEMLVKVFFSLHNPTTMDQQGDFIGKQYRSVIFFFDEEQQKIARQVLEEIDQSDSYVEPIVTEVRPYVNFHPAEEIHQRFLERGGNPGKIFSS